MQLKRHNAARFGSAWGFYLNQETRPSFIGTDIRRSCGMDVLHPPYTFSGTASCVHSSKLCSTLPTPYCLTEEAKHSFIFIIVFFNSQRKYTKRQRVFVFYLFYNYVFYKYTRGTPTSTLRVPTPLPELGLLPSRSLHEHPRCTLNILLERGP